MLELQNATQEAVHDEMIMNMAAAIYHHKDEMTSEEFARALFEYSAALSSMTTTLVMINSRSHVHYHFIMNRFLCCIL